MSLYAILNIVSEIHANCIVIVLGHTPRCRPAYRDSCLWHNFEVAGPLRGLIRLKLSILGLRSHCTHPDSCRLCVYNNDISVNYWAGLTPSPAVHYNFIDQPRFATGVTMAMHATS